MVIEGPRSPHLDLPMHYLPSTAELNALLTPRAEGSSVRRLLSALSVLMLISCLSADLSRAWLGVSGSVICGVIAIGLGLTISVAKISWRMLLRRWVLFLPWLVSLSASIPLSQGWESGAPRMLGMIVKGTLAFTTLLILVQTTPMRELLGALRRLGMPALLVSTLEMMDRYRFVLVEELASVRRAQLSRTFQRRPVQQLLANAALVGLVLVRALRRSDRIHASMLSRGSDSR